MPYKNTADAKAAQKRRYIHHRESNPFKWKCTKSRSRAQHLNVPFDLTPEYLASIFTGFCEASGTPITIGTERSCETTAELDRLIPALGYIQGNVAFLSRRMNRIKNDGTLDELKQVTEWLESKLNT